MKDSKCDICNKSSSDTELISAHGIRHEVEQLLRNDYPEWTDGSYICKEDLNKYKIKYVTSLIEEEKGSTKALEEAVIKSISDNDIITLDTRISDEPITFGERIADKVASFGGSWMFIIIFFVILMVWIVMNSLLLLYKPFDPYPFILLNLILSCLAAIQAPIIMMSQNRQETKDRHRSENDYKINLKSEIEIRTLHEKVDHLLFDQWSKMIKIQEFQIEILEEIRNKVDKK
jgi:uncharacterized membrane protein